MLAWGVILLLCWAIPTGIVAARYANGMPDIGGLIASQFVGVIVMVIGLPLLVIGLRAEIRARRFDRQDWAMATALAEELSVLSDRPATSAYVTHDGFAHLETARLVEVERHFDTQTVGQITGVITHRMNWFGAAFGTSFGGSSAITSSLLRGSVNGLSEADLHLSATTRNNLMGDALFAVFEAPGPAGDRDTYRVIGMSRQAAANWMSDLINQVVTRFGGYDTCSGVTVNNFGARLVARFCPQDTSYVTDRLKALSIRPYEDREQVAVDGLSVGRHAVLASQLRIGPGESLLLFPSEFPVLLGNAVAAASTRADRQLSSGRKQEVSAG